MKKYKEFFDRMEKTVGGGDAKKGRILMLLLVLLVAVLVCGYTFLLLCPRIDSMVASF